MKIGTRGTAMARAQTAEVARLIRLRGVDAEPRLFTPRGDRDLVSRLDVHGGKGGAFVDELRAAMIACEVDCAVHSLKDMPGDVETPGLVIAAYLKREAPEDAIVLARRADPAEAIDRRRLAGAKIGTNSIRRAALLKRLYPQAEIIHFRGAADTRLDKLDRGVRQKLPEGGEVGPADALVMAAAGLRRIGRADRISKLLSIDDMLPAVGQGIIAVECPASAFETRRFLAAIDDPETRAAAEAEREMLWVLNGHCNAPIAGHAQLRVSRLALKGAVISPGGETLIEACREGPIDRPRELGRAVGLELLDKGAKAVIEKTRPPCSHFG
jgi:hydroxymethylbilane synthase